MLHKITYVRFYGDTQFCKLKDTWSCFIDLSAVHRVSEPMKERLYHYDYRAEPYKNDYYDDGECEFRRLQFNNGETLNVTEEEFRRLLSIKAITIQE